MPKVYSPSQTENYLWCPQYRRLKQEGWTKKEIGNNDWAAILGGAFAAGMASYNVVPSLESALVEGTRECEKRLLELGSSGRLFEELAQKNSLLPRLQRAIKLSIENDPLPPQWERRHVEYTLPNSGNSRIDLGLWDGNAPIVVDYKLKLRLEAKWRAKELAKWRRSWQLFHYSYFYGLDQGRETQRYIVILTVLEPKFEIIPLDLTTVWLTPEMMAQWFAFATQAWQDMEAEENGTRTVRGRIDCVNQYGPCEMLRACWSHFYDESLMGFDYVKIPRT